MKMTKVTLPGSTFNAPEVIATGIEGGGYVEINCDTNVAPIGTEEILTDINQHAVLPLANTYYKFYLKEGEKLYGRSTSTSFNLSYRVVYHNQAPSSNNNNPLSFAGTINLSQS